MRRVVALVSGGVESLALLERMARDLHLPVQIVPCPTVRERDGLALSSRNAFLSPEDRLRAPAIHQALVDARRLARRRGARPREVAVALRRRLERVPGARVDYAVVADPETLEEAATFRGPTRALAAVRLGRTRLIDNLEITP